jgi:DNA polymerase-3 subunit alpha
VEAIEAAYAYGQRVQADRQAGQNSLFGGPESATPMEPALPVVTPWNRSTLLREERELMGFYLSGHPLQDYEAELRPFVSRNIADVTQADTEGMEFVEGRRRGPQHTLSGIITDVQQRRTKQGKPMLIATLEDLTGQAEVVFFAGVLDRVAVHVRPDEVCLIKGSLEFRGGGLKIVGQEIWPIWKVREQLIQSITVTINPSTLSDEQQAALVKLCDAHRGSTPLYFTLDSDRFPSTLKLRARNTVVSCDEELLSGLRALFGPDAIALGRSALS